MGLLLRIAWRNIWRNPRRSWVLITAVAVGIFCFLGSISFLDGITHQMVTSTISTQGGHITIAAEGYHQNPTIQKTIDQPDSVARTIDAISEAAYAPLVSYSGMATSAGVSAGVQINGVAPAQERNITTIPESVTDGEWLGDHSATNEIVIGEALAERLDVRLGERMVLMSNNLSNDVSGAAFEIIGYYRTANSGFDERNVYVHLQDARELVGYRQQITAFSVRLPGDAGVEPIVERLKNQLSQAPVEVLSWRARFPVLVTTLEAYDYNVYILVLILFTAVAFTIINSFLMVIFERIHELGIMMATGTKPRQIRIMLYFEAVFIILIGTAAGVAAASGLIAYWQSVGLDLSMFAAGLEATGVGTVIYPYIDWSHIGLGFALIVVLVLLAVLYPAFKASRFEPVDAIEYV